MFAIVHMDDVVRIPPNMMKKSLNETTMEILKEKYESMINPELGYVVRIIDAKTNKVGNWVSVDGATFHKVSFKALTFYQKLQKFVKGEFVEIMNFGPLVRIVL